MTPVFVVLLIADFGWRAPFFVFALVGLVWAASWFLFYRDLPSEHKSVNAAELALITDALGSAPKPSRAVKVPWSKLLGNSQIWTLSAMYFCYAYSIGIFLTWFPTYLKEAHEFNLTKMGLYASLPLLAGVVGDIAGGWISDRMAHRSGNLTMSRRLVAMTGFLIAAVTIPLAVLSADPMTSVAWFGLAVFGLELTVGVSWAVTLDIGGNYAGSVSAVMNTCGNIGGAIASFATGYIVTYAGWNPAFFVLAVLCFAAALLFLRIDASKPLYRSDPAPA